MLTVEDDVVDTAFLTKYDETDNKITVGENVYKLAKKYSVTLNDNDEEYATLVEALKALKVDDVKKIEKAIEVTLTLDEDDKVEAIDMLASADLTDTSLNKISAEVLVTKVKETSSKYTIYTDRKSVV